MVKNYLDCPDVNRVLQSVTEEECGGPVRVVFTLGDGSSAAPHRGRSTPPAPRPRETAPSATDAAPSAPPKSPSEAPPWEAPSTPADRMDELVTEGRRLDNFNIK